MSDKDGPWHGDDSGKITRHYTVWCAVCAKFQEAVGPIGNKRDWEESLPRYGWRKIRGLWHCPDCADEQEARDAH